jgi:hypothetical protein
VYHPPDDRQPTREAYIPEHRVSCWYPLPEPTPAQAEAPKGKR